MTKKNRATIQYRSASDPNYICEKVIDYNSTFSFAETAELMMFIVNNTPIWVIPKKSFVGMDLKYETDPDDAPVNDESSTDGVIQFPKH